MALNESYSSHALTSCSPSSKETCPSCMGPGHVPIRYGTRTRHAMTDIHGFEHDLIAHVGPRKGAFIRKIWRAGTSCHDIAHVLAQGRTVGKWCSIVCKHSGQHGHAQLEGALTKGTEAHTEVMSSLFHHGWSVWCLHHGRKRNGERMAGACAHACHVQPFVAFAPAFGPRHAAFGQFSPGPPPLSSQLSSACGGKPAAQRESTSPTSPSLPTPPSPLATAMATVDKTEIVGLSDSAVQRLRATLPPPTSLTKATSSTRCRLKRRSSPTDGDLPADLGAPLDIPAASLRTCARRLARKHHSDKFSCVEGRITLQPPGLIATLSWSGPPSRLCGSFS